MTNYRNTVKNIIFILKGFIFRIKENYYCPICQKSYLNFAEFNNRKNAICFGCNSLERDRLHFTYLYHCTDLFNGKKKSLLHFAPEKGIAERIEKSKQVQYTSADLLTTINYRFQAIPKLVMSITNIEFENETFDFIFCSHVLDDVSEDKLAFLEIFRVLKYGGLAVLSVPMDMNIHNTIEFEQIANENELRKKYSAGMENKRIYGMDIINKLNLVGFNTKLVKASDFLNNAEILKYSVREKDAFLICQK